MLLLALCTLALGQIVLGQSPLVTTSQGTMKGKVLKSRDGRDFFSFTRIPFAKPPLGQRRFMISEKADNWTGTLDATQDTPMCYQTFLTLNLGQEDCLYLNVFTPNLTGKVPVIFSIYGGAFMGGSTSTFGSANFFMDEDVIFVAPNYRVGIMGFLSLEDNVIPGNMGLKDQALALEWVYKEISAFGGDPNRITVIGQSAGGASADFICSAPRTNGLIKGCVSQSGVGGAPWSLMPPGIARQLGLNLAKAVGCSDNGDLLKCLQSKPPEIVSNMSLVVDNNNQSALLVPVLEPVDAPGAFLTSWPTTASHNYPWIIGFNQDEGLMLTLAYENHFTSQEDTEKFINSFNSTIIKTFHLENRPDDVRRMRERYFTKGVEPLKAIRNFFSEFLYWYPSWKSLSKHPGPTYHYKFNYTQAAKTIVNNGPAAPHGAEMPYFFDIIPQTADWPKPEDVALSKQMVKMWVNFARDQRPSSQETIQWPQFQGQYYLDFQDTGVRISNLTDYQETLDFWKSYIPDEPKPSESSVIEPSLVSIALICSVINAIIA